MSILQSSVILCPFFFFLFFFTHKEMRVLVYIYMNERLEGLHNYNVVSGMVM